MSDAVGKDRAAARAAAPERWPIRVYRLGEEPSEDLSATTTPAQRLAMMWPLALDAWAAAGRSARLSAPPGADSQARWRHAPHASGAGMLGLNDDFRDLLAALSQQGASYLVVGAHAMAVHGVPRATGDLDICVRPDPANAARLLRALVAFGAPVKAMGVTDRDLAVAGVVYQIGLPPRRIDILTEIRQRQETTCTYEAE